MTRLKLLLLPAVLMTGLLSACGGGGDSISQAIDDIQKGVTLDKYEDSCGTDLRNKNIDVKPGTDVKMSIRVKTTGDVEPLTADWHPKDDALTVLGLPSLPKPAGDVDGTGRLFSLSVPVKNTGKMVFELVVRDKKGEERFRDQCEVHVNII